MKTTIIGLVIILAASANAQWTVVNLHPAGATESRALGVGGGQQVGGAIVGGWRRASLWGGTAASWVDLTPAGASTSYAYGVDGGQQVGWAVVGDQRASLWSGTASSWVDLNPAGATASTAYGVNSGHQVGLASWGDQRASLWSGSASSWVNLHPVGWRYSFAYGVGGGQQVGFATPFGSSLPSASLWTGTAGSWVSLHPAGALESIAYGVAGGQQVGWAYVGGVQRASLWTGTAASWVDLNPAGAAGSQALGVHAGRQVGGAVVGGIGRASLWSGTAASWVDLHALLPPGFTYSTAEGISHEGGYTYVVGFGYNNTTGREEALMWISQSVAPTSYSMFRGSVFSGNLASLQNSDDNRLVMRPGITLGTSQPPIQIILNATAPTASPNGFSFSLESSASFGNAQQKISLYNFNTGLYEELDARLAKTTDDTITVTVRTNPSRFIQAGTLAIRALVSFRAVGPSLAFPWSGRIDKVWWTFPG